MREGRLVRGLAAWLPRDVRERIFEPAYHDLLIDTADSRHTRWSRLGFAARAAGILASCAVMALASARRPPRPGSHDRRRAWGVVAGQIVTQDLRFAWRIALAQPLLTLAVVATLALGIGGVSAVYAVVRAVVLRPLPYHEPDRLVALRETSKDRLTSVSPVNFYDWRARARSFSSMAIYADEGRLALSTGQGPDLVGAVRASASFFTTLGTPPVLGRALRAEGDREGAEQEVVISYGLWKSRFGGREAAVGATARLNGRPRTIVGVMPAGFDVPEGTDVWLPLEFAAEDLDAGQRGAHYVDAIARLRAGVTLQAARAELDAIARQLATTYPRTNLGRGTTVEPLLESLVKSVRQALLVLLAAVALVLLIACVNVSNLLLARASTRRHEMAVRLALGARRAALVRQLLVESLLLGLMGGAAGLLLAYWGVGVLLALAPVDLPRAGSVRVDLGVVALAGAAGLGSALVFGLAPIVHVLREKAGGPLREGRGDTVVSSSGRRTRELLMVGQVGVAVVLLVGAGLALRTLGRLTAMSPGFDADHVLRFTVSAPGARYPDGPSLASFYRRLIDDLKRQPGVEAAGAAMLIPLSTDGFGGTFTIEGRPFDPRDEPNAQIRVITPGYLEVLHVPVRWGRAFTDRDDERGPAVAMVSETAARRYWPGEDPVGRRVRPHVGMGHPIGHAIREIVGVVADVRIRSLDEETPPVIYVPHAQYLPDTMTILARTAGDPLALVASARASVRRLDHEIPLADVGTLDAHVRRSVADRRFIATVLGSFGGASLALAVIGLYGAMGFSVAQRRYEIGVRLALGAVRGDVLRLIVGRGMLAVVGGLALGLAGAVAASRVMASLLFGVTPTDPATYAVASGLMLSASLVACYLPARRAARVDPATTLRAE